MPEERYDATEKERARVVGGGASTVIRNTIVCVPGGVGV